MKSCPVKTDPAYVEVERELGASRAILSFHRNKEVMPDILKAYELLNLVPPADTIQRKRNDGYRIIRGLIDDNINGINDKKIEEYKDIIRKYGYDSNIVITQIGKNYYFTDSSGDLINSSMVEKTIEGEGYKKTLRESLSSVSEGLKRVVGFTSSVNSWFKLQEKLQLPDDFLNLLYGIIEDLKTTGRSNVDNDIASVLLVSLFEDNAHVKRLISFYTRNPDITKSFSKMKNYDLFASGSDNQLVAKYVVSNLIGITLYKGVDALDDIHVSSQIKSLVEKASEVIRKKLNDVDLSQVQEIFQQYSEKIGEIDSLREKKELAESVSSSLNTGNSIASIESTIKRRKSILSALLDVENTRSELEKKGAKNKANLSRFTRRLNIILDHAVPLWNTAPEKIEYLLTIYKFLDAGLVNDLIELENEIKQMKGEYTHRNAKILLSVKRTLDAYKEAIAIIDYELNLIRNGYVAAGVKDSVVEDLVNLTGELNSKLDSLETLYKLESDQLLRKFFSPFIPNGGIKMGDKYYTMDDFINVSEQDIGMITRFLQSVKDSTSPFLRILNEPVRMATLRKYNRTRDYAARIIELREELSKAGYKNDSFVYQMDEKGKPTGNFIPQFNDKLHRDRDNFMRKYMTNDPNATLQDAYNAFLAVAGKEVNGVYYFDVRYHSQEYKNLSQAQKKYLDGIMEVKIELTKMLPFQMRVEQRAPQVRKSVVERLFNGGNVFENLKKAVAEGFTVEQHDNVILEKNSIGNKGFKLVPVRHIGLMEDMNDLSLDAAGSMIAFANMAINYDEMNNIVDAMEIMKDYVFDGKVRKTKNGLSVLREIAGKAKTAVTIEGAASNLLARIDDFYAMNIYGEKSADEGTIGNTNISKRKATNQIIKATVMNTLAFNALAGISNVVTGKHNVILEGIAGELFKLKHLKSADAAYLRDLPAIIMDMEASVKKSKTNKIDSLFRITQGIENDFSKWELYQKSRLFRMLSPKYAFVATMGGEHYIANVLGTSIIKGMDVLDKDGNKTDLYSQIDTSGMLAVIKKGTRNLDGTPFTDEDLQRVQGIIREANESSQGIYNTENMAAFQAKWTGALVFLYRRYFIPNINRRFQKSTPNLILGKEVEGFYRTLWRMMMGIYKDGFNLAMFFKTYNSSFTPHERANVKRALYELSYVFASVVTFSLLSAAGFGDDEDPYWQRMLKYQVRRTTTEVGAFTPVFLLREMLTLIKTPSATFDYIDKYNGFLKIHKYFHVYQSGPYKDMMGWQKNIIEVAPYYRNFIRNGTPEQTLKYLTNR